MFCRLVALGVMVLGVGCSRGPALWPVTGQVVYPDGAPVTSAVIEFAPVEGGPGARSAVAADGSFELRTEGREGAVVGNHRVVVVQLFQTEGAPKHVHAKRIRRVDARYRSFATSKLERAVEPKRNTFRIEVEPGRE